MNTAGFPVDNHIMVLKSSVRISEVTDNTDITTSVLVASSRNAVANSVDLITGIKQTGVTPSFTLL